MWPVLAGAQRRCMPQPSTQALARPNTAAIKASLPPPDREAELGAATAAAAAAFGSSTDLRQTCAAGGAEGPEKRAAPVTCTTNQISQSCHLLNTFDVWQPIALARQSRQQGR